ncbi:MAG: XdhC family protein [Gammaproteobacteria bacterium]|nr:XdhC family protein [Gammaproteobacteria bacterium]
MEASVGPLLPLFARERAAGRALALGVLVHTDGSTYRKPGALILIAADGAYAGLISGGCLEEDLRQHAHSVIAGAPARSLRYELRGDDLLWGLGLGCEGTMQMLLVRVGPENDWQPLSHFAAALAARRPTAIGLVVDSASGQLPPGSLALLGDPQVAATSAALHALTGLDSALAEAAPNGRERWVEASSCRVFVMPLALPPRIVLLGAGPDAVPVVDFAVRLDWKVTLLDHRPAYAVAAHFPGAEQVLLTPPDEVSRALELGGFRAAVVMSHHLPTDLAYLRSLAATAIPYVGLLGPPQRRARLLAELGADAQALLPRLHAPVGLALGGRAPESIALAIVAQLHAFLHGGAATAAGAAAAAAPRL